MEGLFYYHDSFGLTFLRFYDDGRIVSYGSYTMVDQFLPKLPWHGIEFATVHYSRGFYQIEKEDGIRIVITGDFGKLVYRGTIRDVNTIDLVLRCPMTNFEKSATFLRYSDEQHIIHIELTDTYVN